MLSTLGLTSLDELIDQRFRRRTAAPAAARPTALSKSRRWRRRGPRLTATWCSLVDRLRLPRHDHARVLRNISENLLVHRIHAVPTRDLAGRLEALLNFQDTVRRPRRMDIAKCVRCSTSTAAAEAMAMLHRVQNKPPSMFVVDPGVTRRRSMSCGCGPSRSASRSSSWIRSTHPLEGVYGVPVQHPGPTEPSSPLEPIVQRAPTPACWWRWRPMVPPSWCCNRRARLAPICVIGSTQRFGVPMGFGGRHAALMATRDVFKRSLPGRLVGVSVDTAGTNRVPTGLQRVKQHIRREKATTKSAPRRCRCR